MNLEIRKKFEDLWQENFGREELPLTFFYTDAEAGAELVPPPKGHRCLICQLAKARQGTPLRFDLDSITCGGGKRYLGFTQTLRPGFEHFLSCGIPGKMEGERYKKTPEIVRELLANMKTFDAPARFIAFKRWDQLQADDDPAVVIFFARPDVLSGLFTLAGFDRADPFGVIAPFAAGCGSIVQYPYLERDADRPRAVLGMFDVSARPCVSENTLTLSLPMKKFETMIADIPDSFLITTSWDLVKRRIAKG